MQAREEKLQYQVTLKSNRSPFQSINARSSANTSFKVQGRKVGKEVAHGSRIVSPNYARRMAQTTRLAATRFAGARRSSCKKLRKEVFPVDMNAGFKGSVVEADICRDIGQVCRIQQLHKMLQRVEMHDVRECVDVCKRQPAAHGPRVVLIVRVEVLDMRRCLGVRLHPRPSFFFRSGYLPVNSPFKHQPVSRVPVCQEVKRRRKYGYSHRSPLKQRHD